MGAIRDRDFDAVIGVGGVGFMAKANGIASQVNWIGIGPHKFYVGKRGPEVMFDHFRYYGTNGPDFRELAPILAKRMYNNNVRSLLHGLNSQELAEAVEIVQLAVDAPPSPGLEVAEKRGKAIRKCRSRGRAGC
jgi:hypothetical protein